ncbi:MAG: putative membrane protein YeiH [Cyclobacteriaceae bacterium]|jgi:uncharacterized membrane protein YeiH
MPTITNDLLVYLNYAGCFVFALSGGAVAIRHQMDLFGVVVIGLITAVGGGTLRDVLLNLPVFWLENSSSLIPPLLGSLCAFTLGSNLPRKRIMLWADALGLAVFAILGCVSALKAGSTPIIAIVMGTITACAGGLIRDIVCNEPPILLKDEIYATAALFGAIIYIASLQWPPIKDFAAPLGITTAFATRLIAIQWHITLPKSSKT